MSDPQLDSQIVPTDFGPDAFAEWIGGATIAKRSVVIYGKPGLYADYEQTARDLEIAEAAEADGGELAGSQTARLRARMAEIHDEWMASKSIWVVRALTGEELGALSNADETKGYTELVAPVEPERPAPPQALPKSANDTAQRAHAVAMQRHEAAMAAYAKDIAAYQTAATQYNAELNLRGVVEALVSITFADDRTVEAITVDQLRTMRATLGDIQILRLATAAQAAAIEEPVIPAPFLPRSSETPPTS